MVDYEIRDGKDVFREGEKVASFDKSGEVIMEPGMERFISPVQERVKLYLDTAASAETSTLVKAGKDDVRPEKITTVRQLIDAMQPYVTEQCPKMRPWLGDEDPDVKDWLQKHDDVRLNVLRGR